MYFELLFQHFDKEETTFYQKSRFLNYKFKSEQNHSILDLLKDIIDLCEDDYSIIDRILGKSFLDLDPRIYSNNLVFDEIVRPIVAETDSLFVVDKYFIDKTLREKCKLRNAEKKAIVKCKAICIPNIIDINDPKTEKIFAHLSDGDPSDGFFNNDVFYILVHYIWESQIKFYYKIETGIFLFFFVLFNLNFLFVLRNSDMGGSTKIGSIALIFDYLLILYTIYCLCNEFWQMRRSGFFDYFKSLWNYFDIALVPLLLTSSLFDILLVYNKEIDMTLARLVFAACMFCFWFRFLSFFRAMQETASTMRLILNVITSVKHFVMFMILFMLTITTTFMILIIDQNGDSGLWQTFFDIYLSTVGDYDAITDYATDSTIINQLVVITSTFLFAIILLNLLVAILGDKHNEINDAEEQTRLYELTNIIWDTHTAIITKLIKHFKKPAKRGNYLIYLYNEKHESKKINEFEGIEMKVEESSNNLNKRLEKMEEMLSEGFDKINEYFLEYKAKKLKD